MKRILFYACFLTIGYTAHAQVGIGTPDPKSSAMLDVDAIDKGILIPRVVLTSPTVFAPITGEQVEGLLVYNLGDTGMAPPLVQPGFYYWSNNKWNQVINEANLQDIVTNIEENLINNVIGDMSDLQKAIDHLLPTNPKSGDKSIPHSTLVYDPATSKMYIATYDATEEKYINTEVNLENLIQGLESETLFKRAKVDVDGQLNWVDTAAVIPADTKKGEIYYQYTGENGRIDYLNLTEDILNVFSENESIKNEIVNIINEGGGNVYYTNVELTADGIPANSLYQVDPVSKEKKIIDIESNIKNFFEEKFDFIKQEIGDKVTNNTVINTGNKIDGDDVYLFKNAARFTNTGAKIDEITVTMPANTTAIDRVVSIKLFKDKKIISTSVTGLVITGATLNFYMGEGSMYYPQAAGNNYEVIIEFTAR
ncbi:hypothetical protein [Myroides odoratus]|uniref:Uncharacterized protein n=1 Tax=Myroides odoratus TaxID=256 RepID=A0A378RL72_MYROD|nr:hypothetical protein [Myroides odoratus]QQU04823.1 hypothetical protein I6I89_05915 [Myroides odoratus]STZ27724.1 Uncharacterised protein [Myroides odoratus]